MNEVQIDSSARWRGSSSLSATAKSVMHLNGAKMKGRHKLVRNTRCLDDNAPLACLQEIAGGTENRVGNGVSHMLD
jgi:hypothetical protein